MNPLPMLPWTALLLIHVVFSHLPKRRHVTGSEYVAGYMKGLRDLRHDKLLFLAFSVLGVPYLAWWLAVPLYVVYPTFFRELNLGMRNSQPM